MVNIGADRSPERARQDYVKVIYQLGQEKAVRAAELARHLGVTRASVSKFKRMLEHERLIYRSRRPTDALRLTRKGQRLAVRMVRRHRLVETFLHTTLRVPLERVHTEAERIEHAISDDVSARLAQFLDNPVADPHGHRIPDGVAARKGPREERLTRTSVGSKVVVTSIDDRDAHAVRKLAALGILPGMRAIITANDGDRIHLRAGRRQLDISASTLRGVRCERV